MSRWNTPHALWLKYIGLEHRNFFMLFNYYVSMRWEELEHDYEKNNAMRLQSTYFIILMTTKTDIINLRGDMQNLQCMTFNSFILLHII